jgi:hypothetical protein
VSDRRGAPGPVSPPVALALTTVGFFTLTIAGMGLISLATDADVLTVPGIGQIPGAAGVIAAGAAYAAGAWRMLRAARPRYTGAVWVALIGYLVYGAATGFAALVVTGQPATALAVTGALLVGWAGLVVAASAAVAAWSAVALVRTRASRPRWPWERDDEE